MSELERALSRLGAELAFPPEPDFAAAVADRLRREPERQRFRRPLVLAFAAALAAVAVALAVPPARSALFDVLHIGGETIERTGTQPRAPAHGVRGLGAPVSLFQARAAVDFPVLTPPVASGVFLDRSLPGGKVSFRWAERGRAVVLSEFEGDQIPFAMKLVGPETTTVHTHVDGAEALWITGAPHLVIWRDKYGEIRSRTRRLAGNVLIWDRAGVTYRLEGLRTEARALAIARSLG